MFSGRTLTDFKTICYEERPVSDRSRFGKSCMEKIGSGNGTLRRCYSGIDTGFEAINSANRGSFRTVLNSASL